MDLEITPASYMLLSPTDPRRRALYGTSMVRCDTKMTNVLRPFGGQAPDESVYRTDPAQKKQRVVVLFRSEPNLLRLYIARLTHPNRNTKPCDRGMRTGHSLALSTRRINRTQKQQRASFGLIRRLVPPSVPPSLPPSPREPQSSCCEASADPPRCGGRRGTGVSRPHERAPAGATGTTPSSTRGGRAGGLVKGYRTCA